MTENIECVVPSQCDLSGRNSSEGAVFLTNQDINIQQTTNWI